MVGAIWMRSAFSSAGFNATSEIRNIVRRDMNNENLGYCWTIFPKIVDLLFKPPNLFQTIYMNEEKMRENWMVHLYFGEFLY